MLNETFFLIFKHRDTYKYIFFCISWGFLSTRWVSKHIGKHFYYVLCKGSLDLIIASGVMNTFRMISLQALQAHRPWANLCIIIWANVAFQQKLSRSTSLHTISPFPLSNFRQFFFCIQTVCSSALVLLKTTYCARETIESDFFFLASLVQQKKESTFCTAHFSIRHKSFIFFFPLFWGKTSFILLFSLTF